MVNRRPAAGSVLILLALTGCFSSGNTDSLREHTADATAAAKRDAGAIARGIAEGLKRGAPLDLNHASLKQLETLPEITPEQARAIVENRPYNDPSDLLHRHVLNKPQYNRIKAQVVVK